jgi:hypothetical protein
MGLFKMSIDENVVENFFYLQKSNITAKELDFSVAMTG